MECSSSKLAQPDPSDDAYFKHMALFTDNDFQSNLIEEKQNFIRNFVVFLFTFSNCSEHFIINNTNSILDTYIILIDITTIYCSILSLQQLLNWSSLLLVIDNTLGC